MANTSVKKGLTFRNEFENDIEIQKYGKSSLSLFVLSLYLRLEDLDDFAANAVTEGSDDKKTDICYLDIEAGRLIISQNYLSPKWNKKSAPDKASDLNTSIAWLFSADIEKVPPGLQAKAVELRDALQNGEIKSIEVLYIHNCPESKNIDRELSTVTAALRDILRSQISSKSKSINIWHREIGLKTIEELYRARDSQILIDELIDVPADKNIIHENTTEWNAILVTVSASWIRDLYNKYKNDLFSANYRDYLGFVEDEDNINYQIVATAETEPENFWVFNNGITALTYKIEFSGRKKRITGISIINGAQTSGALGTTSKKSADQAKVLMRIVECKSTELVDNIIQYNNTQNEIKPEDRRSKDKLQHRLCADFKKFNIDYHYRRSEKKISRTTITAKLIAPWLCAIHGEPQVSYRNPKKIFKDDDTYDRVFTQNIQVGHMFLVWHISKAIDEIKKELKKKVAEGIATKQERKQFQVLKYSASKHFLLYIIGDLSEQIMGRQVTNLFDWECKSELISPSNTSLLKALDVTLRALLPFIADILEKRGGDSYYDVPRSDKLTKEASEEVQLLITSLKSHLEPQFLELRKRTLLK